MKRKKKENNAGKILKKKENILHNSQSEAFYFSTSIYRQSILSRVSAASYQNEQHQVHLDTSRGANHLDTVATGKEQH